MTEDRRAQTAYQQLSPREQEVLAWLLTRYENKEIAAQLCISRSTLQQHIAAIYTKLGCTNRMETALYVLQSGICRVATLEHSTEKPYLCGIARTPSRREDERNPARVRGRRWSRKIRVASS